MSNLLSAIGATIAMYGLLSMVFYFLDYDLRFMHWIDVWGSTLGLFIRFIFFIIGGVVFILFGKSKTYAS